MRDQGHARRTYVKNAPGEADLQRVRKFMALALVACLLLPGPAGAQFTIGGKKVPPIETNFAGVRQVSPRYGLVVQINHDARTAGDFELSLLDDAYANLLHQYRGAPPVPTDLVPSCS